MESNLVSLNRVFLNLTRPSNRQLTFAQGDVLRGVVQDVSKDGVAQLLIKGQLIEALAEADIKAGQSLYLLVEEVRTGRVSLKLLTPESISRMEQINLAAQLQEMGVSPREETIKLARVLLDHHLPVTRASLADAQQILHRLGPASPQNLALTAWAVQHQIPASTAILERMSHFLNPPSDIGKLYEQLTRIITRLLEERAGNQVLPSLAQQRPVNASIQTPPPPSFLGGQLLSGQETGRRLTQPGGWPAQTVSAQETGGEMPRSAGLGSSMPSAPPAQGFTEVQTWSFQRFDQAGAAKLLNHLYTLLQMVPLDAKEPSSSLTMNLQQLVQFRPEVWEGLLISGQLLAKHPAVQEWGDLLSLVKSLEQELGGQQIMNTASRFTPETNPGGFYLSFPVQLEEQVARCQLRFRRNQRRAASDQDSLRLVVSLETHQLGWVLFHIDWKKAGSLDLQGVVNRESVRRYLDLHVSELTGSLEKLGYRVNHHGIKVVTSQAEYESVRPGIEASKDAKVHPISIDVLI